MSTPYTCKIRGPFESLDRVEQALRRTESISQSSVKSVSDITSIPNGERVALLVEFASGVKVKLLVSGSEKESFEFVKRCLELPRWIKVPSVLLVEDGWAAFEWIDGPTLDQHGVTDSLVREAAQLLSGIHTVRTDVTAELVMNRVRQKLEEKLPLLVSHQIISVKASDLVLKLCQSISNFDISLIHGDFSPSNLVVSETGLFSIDNEKLTAHASDYDLCRAANLWDEWNSSGGALFQAYCECASREVNREGLFFWSIFDLVYKISYRISLGEMNDFCVNRLRQMLPN